MAFLILDQIRPSGNPTVLFHEQRRFCRAQTSDVHLVRTITAWCLFPGSCWKLLEAWLVSFHALSLQSGCWMVGGARQGNEACTLAGHPKGLLGACTPFTTPSDEDENHPESGEVTIMRPKV